MNTSFSALLVGLTMICSAGIAQAADMNMVKTDTHEKVGITEQSKSVPKARLALSDDQMEGITAGHISGGGNWHDHYGYYYSASNGNLMWGLHYDPWAHNAPY
jgi:hypothetical protein